jgi:hypothetical protein
MAMTWVKGGSAKALPSPSISCREHGRDVALKAVIGQPGRVSQILPHALRLVHSDNERDGVVLSVGTVW